MGQKIAGHPQCGQARSHNRKADHYEPWHFTPSLDVTAAPQASQVRESVLVSTVIHLQGCGTLHFLYSHRLNIFLFPEIGPTTGSYVKVTPCLSTMTFVPNTVSTFSDKSRYRITIVR